MLIKAQQRWEVVLGEPNTMDHIFNKLVSYDDGYLFSWVQTSGTGFLVKTDKNGSELWKKKIVNGPYNTFPSGLAQSNEQIIVAGGTENFPFIMSLNLCGELNWCSKYKNDQYDHGNFENVVILDNGDIIAMAYLEPPDVGDFTDRIFLFYYDFYNTAQKSDN